MAKSIQLTIDGRSTTVPDGTTIWDAARLMGIKIPTLCHQLNQTPVGVCRLCVVDVGARVYTPACARQVEEGMTVSTQTDEVQRAQRILVELLLADHPIPCARQQLTGDCELESYARQFGMTQSRFSPKSFVRGQDDSSGIIAVNHEACILCDRCIRGCNEIKKNFVIGRMGKGYTAGIAFDNDLPMGSSTCVSCGECMVSCPTGALTNKGVVGVEPPSGESLPADELLKLPIFKGVSGTFLNLNEGAVVRKKFKKGEIICREGDFGSTAFYILKGKVDVFITTPMAHSKSRAARGEGGFLAFVRKLTSLASSREDSRGEKVRRWIPIDAPVDLDYYNPVAQLQEGDLFGEMTCMNFYPRSATVRAATDGELLEMLRNVLDILQKNKDFKEKLEKTYRQRALDNHLRSVPIFADISQDFLDYLRERVELIRYKPGEVIILQDDPADSFYLIRLGFVKVTQHHPGGEFVLSYLSRGQFFGEIGLLNGGRRTATCTALDHVEVVRIRADDFNLMVQKFPGIREAINRTAMERLEENQKMLRTVRTVELDDFLVQGLMEAQSLLLLDLEKCTRCDDCVRACAAAHDGVSRLYREGLRFDKYLVATSCRSCMDPLCMVGCPVGSIRRKNDREILIEDWCIGCGLCASQCPYGNITMHGFQVTETDTETPGRKRAEVRRKATTCDLCTDYAEPSCVYACPHDAAHRVDNPREFIMQQLGLSSAPVQIKSFGV